MINVLAEEKSTGVESRIKFVKMAIDDAGIGESQIDKIVLIGVLVGGTTRIEPPEVRTTLRSRAIY